MISVIAYGRNDSYGLQTAKRVTISINAMAQMLDPDIGDEIIYVDYNTADELPSLPECLADTFTARALSLLRVLRVRKSHHKRFAEHTHLPVLEPIARNVAIRRANPANRWLQTSPSGVRKPSV